MQISEVMLSREKRSHRTVGESVVREENAVSFQGALGVLATTAVVALNFDHVDVSPDE